MRDNILFLLFALMFMCCGTTKNGNHFKIYNEIYKCQRGDIKYLNQPDVGGGLYFARMLTRMNYLEKLGHPSIHDTIYILQSHDDQGYFSVTIWNKEHSLSYVNENSKLIQTEESLFTKYMIKLVTEWNIPEIRKEEKINPGPIPLSINHATRIIFNNRKYHIDCIKFYDFYNLKRDGLYLGL